MSNAGPVGNKLVLHGAASVSHSGTPSYNWQTGLFGTITDNGAGDLTHNLGTDYSCDTTEVMPLFSRNSAAAASGAVSFGWAPASDTAVRVTVLQEAALGAASALTDVDYFLMIWKRQP